MQALLPEDLLDEIPSGFAVVGHVGMWPRRERATFANFSKHTSIFEINTCHLNTQ